MPSVRAWLGMLLIALVILTIASLLSETIVLSPEFGYAIAFLAVSVSVLSCAWACPKPEWSATIWAGIGATLGLAALGWLTKSLAPLTQVSLVTLILLSAGTLLGSRVGHSIEAPGHLLAVAVVSSLADMWSVFYQAGPSGNIAHNEAALTLLALSWPLLGSSDVIPLIGVGDVIFCAIYIGASRVHALSMARTLVALSLSFVLTLALLFIYQCPIPVLPIMGACILIALPQSRKLIRG
ncbi:MAG: hypothetical protein H6715_02045 [Myxococcales bacterium]|nr:hypothetical protein [Myxococcales bacterium]MCB9707532.1 hypothetical protein [Myxococcales bacterium]